MKKLIKITALTLAIIMMASMPSFAKTLYSIDGRKIDVHQSEVNAYLNVGWYQAPVTIMYSEDDRTIVVYESEVEAYEKVGWTDGKKEIVLFAPDGRTQIIPRSQRATYLNLGWYKYPYYNNAVVTFYPGTNILDFGSALFSTYYGYRQLNGMIIHGYYTSMHSVLLYYPKMLFEAGWSSVNVERDEGEYTILCTFKKNGKLLAVYHNLSTGYTEIAYIQ